MILAGLTMFMKAYPTLHLFRKSILRYRKLNLPLCFSCKISSRAAWLYLFGMFFIIKVVFVSWPIRMAVRFILNSCCCCCSCCGCIVNFVFGGGGGGDTAVDDGVCVNGGNDCDCDCNCDCGGDIVSVFVC